MWVWFVILIILMIFIVTEVQYGQFPIYIGQSQIHGRGMFASRDIKAGETIEYVPIVLFERQDIKPGTILRDYDITFNDNGMSAFMLGYGAIYNHSFKNNAEWFFKNEKTMIIRANKDIKRDSEIFVNYGEGYWNHRPGKYIDPVE